MILGLIGLNKSEKDLKLTNILISHLDIHYKQPQKTINFCGCLWFFVVVCGEFARVISDIHYKVCGFD